MNRFTLYVPQGHTTSANRSFTPEIHARFNNFQVETKNAYCCIYIAYMNGMTRLIPLHKNQNSSFPLKGVCYVNIQRKNAEQMLGVDIDFAN